MDPREEDEIPDLAAITLDQYRTIQALVSQRGAGGGAGSHPGAGGAQLRDGRPQRENSGCLTGWRGGPRRSSLYCG